MKIREVIRMIESDGWYQVDVKGSPHQFKHPVKRGREVLTGVEIAMEELSRSHA
jgi:predicted RNA binding protein YcfA (HicA-like mRNA interferase family)